MTPGRHSTAPPPDSPLRNALAHLHTHTTSTFQINTTVISFSETMVFKRCLVLNLCVLLLCSAPRYFADASSHATQVLRDGTLTEMAASDGIPAAMSAILAENDKCIVKSVDTPKPSGSEVLVKVAATAINRADTLQVSHTMGTTTGTLAISLMFCSVKVPFHPRQVPRQFLGWKPLAQLSHMALNAQCWRSFRLVPRLWHY